jgi:cell division protein FtsW (lipid II flippase)
MLKSSLRYIETALFTAAVSVPVHYLAGLDWPWVIAIGLAASIVLRALIHHRPPTNQQQEIRP